MKSKPKTISSSEVVTKYIQWLICPPFPSMTPIPHLFPVLKYYETWTCQFRFKMGHIYHVKNKWSCVTLSQQRPCHDLIMQNYDGKTNLYKPREAILPFPNMKRSHYSYEKLLKRYCIVQEHIILCQNLRRKPWNFKCERMILSQDRVLCSLSW